MFVCVVVREYEEGCLFVGDVWVEFEVSYGGVW